MRSTVVLPALAVCIALLGGCSIYSAPGTKPAPVEKAPDPAVKPPATAPQTRPSTTTAPASAAYQPLLDKAAQARSRGDYEESLALLQRAQRIDPDSAQIYLAMADSDPANADQYLQGALSALATAARWSSPSCAPWAPGLAG